MNRRKFTPDKWEQKSWRESGFDKYLERKSVKKETPLDEETEYLGGADFDARLDDTEISRIFKLKGLSTKPLGETGRVYWDKVKKKFKLYVDATTGWVDIHWTTTSTSTSTSTSSTSTSTSTS